MKNHLLRFVLIIAMLGCISFLCNAQDIITLKRGSRIEAIVTDIKGNIVRYKYFSDSQGKEYFVYKDMVSSILYQNGTIEQFDNSKQLTPIDSYEQTKSINDKTQNVNINTTQASESDRNSYKDVVYLKNESYDIYSGSNTLISVKFGIKAGYNRSTMSGIKDLNDSYNQLDFVEHLDVSVKNRNGVHAGIVCQIKFSNNFFLQPELLYSLQGVKEIENTQNEEDITDLHYLQLPVYAGCAKNAGSNVDIIIGLGPYFGLGFAGSDKTFGDDGFLRRGDFGLSAIGGVQINNIQLTIGYDLGLIDLIDSNGWKTVKDVLGLSSVSNRNFKISMAYLF